MNRQIFTYAPIISLGFEFPQFPCPINFNDSISKGRSKITCNNNRVKRTRIHVWIGELKLAIQTISWMRIDSRSMREKCKWCDFVERKALPKSLEKFTWKRERISRLLPGDLISWISVSSFAQDTCERDTRQLCWCIISIWYSFVWI